MRFEVRHVVWIDSIGKGGWGSIREFEEMKLDPITTVGFVAREDEESVLLVQSYSTRERPEEDNYDNGILIPKSAIQSQSVIAMVPA